MEDKAIHGRFKGAPWYSKEAPEVLVGGAGGIGSWLTVLLARAGFTPYVFDFDVIEEHNIGGQLYSLQQVGDKKVEALAIVVKESCGTDIFAMDEKVTEDTMTNTFVFSAFDNIKARKDMFIKWLVEYKDDKWAMFIDGRLSAEFMQIFCIRGTDYDAINDYLNNQLPDDSTIEDAPCTMKQTSHAAAMIASHMTGFFTNHISNIHYDEHIREVPYFWEYNIPNNLVTSKERP